MASNFIMPSDANDAGNTPAPTGQNSWESTVKDKYSQIQPKQQNTFADLQKKYKVPTYSQQPPKIDPIGDIWNATGGAIWNQASSAAGDLAGGIGDIGNAINPFSGQDAGQRVQSLGQGAMKLPMGAAKLATTPLAPAISAGSAVLGKTANAAASGVSRFGSGIGKVAQNILPALGNTFSSEQGSDRFGTEVYKGFSDILGGGVDTAMSPLTGTVQALPGTAQAPIAAAGSGIEGLQDWLLSQAKVDVNTEEGRILKENLGALTSLLGAAGATGKAGTIAKAAKAKIGATETGKAFIDALGQAKNVGSNVITKAGKTAGNIGKDASNAILRGVFKTNIDDVSALFKNSGVAKKFLEVADDLDNAVGGASGKFQKYFDDFNSNLSKGGVSVGDAKKLKNRPVTVPEGTIAKAFAREFKMNIKDGKLVPKKGVASRTVSQAELDKANAIIAKYDKGKFRSTEQYMNLRDDLTNMSNFDTKPGKNKLLEDAAKRARKSANKFAHEQLPELKKADANYTKMKGLQDELRAEGLLKKDGTVQQTFSIPENVQKLTQPKYRKLLDRVEKQVPGFKDELQAIRIAQGFKKTPINGSQLVAPFIAGGGGAVGLATGNIPLVLASIAAANPTLLGKAVAFLGKNNKGINNAAKGAANFAKGAKENAKKAKAYTNTSETIFDATRQDQPPQF